MDGFGVETRSANILSRFFLLGHNFSSKTLFSPLRMEQRAAAELKRAAV